MNVTPETVARLSTTFSSSLRTMATHKRRLPRLHPRVDYSSMLFLNALAAGPKRVSALAEETHTDVSTVSRQVSALTGLGLTAKVTDPDDGRAYLVALTTQGEEFIASIARYRATWMSDVLTGWTEDDALALDRLLNKFSQSLIDYETTHLHHPKDHS